MVYSYVALPFTLFVPSNFRLFLPRLCALLEGGVERKKKVWWGSQSVLPLSDIGFFSFYLLIPLLAYTHSRGKVRRANSLCHAAAVQHNTSTYVLRILVQYLYVSRSLWRLSLDGQAQRDEKSKRNAYRFQ